MPMIWLIASLIGGIAFKAWAVILLVVAYLASRKNRDLALLIYFFYGILLINEVRVGDFISYESLKALAIVVPSVAVLEEILGGAEVKIKLTQLQAAGVLILAIGVFYEYLLPVGIALLIAGEDELSFEGLRATVVVLLLLLLPLWVVKERYPHLYTSENQVAIAGSFVVFLILRGVRDLRKVEFELRVKS